MDRQALEALARQYKQYKRMEDELKAELDKLADAIKASVPVGAPVIVGEYKISLAVVNQARLDAAALKRELPEVAARFERASSYERLTVN